MSDKPKLYVMCGMSGSGKTTFSQKFSKTHGLLYINPDRFYALYNGDECNHYNEFEIWMALFRALHMAEQQKIDTIFDTNNPTFAGRVQLTEWFPKFEHHLIVIKADLTMCLRNNANRRRKVPTDEMLRMWDNFQWPNDSETKFWKTVTTYRNDNNELVFDTIKS